VVWRISAYVLRKDLGTSKEDPFSPFLFFFKYISSNRIFFLFIFFSFFFYYSYVPALFFTSFSEPVPRLLWGLLAFPACCQVSLGPAPGPSETRDQAVGFRAEGVGCTCRVPRPQTVSDFQGSLWSGKMFLIAWIIKYWEFTGSKCSTPGIGVN
jgi:hypothetical protein